MPTTKILIPAEPVSQGRPRFARIGTHVAAYDPPASKQYKALVAQYARHQWQALPLDGPVRLRVVFYRPLQKSLTQAQRRRRMAGWERPIVKPDLDNYFKAVTDALKGICWKDDNQIVQVYMAKRYDDGQGPRTEIELEEFAHGD